MGCFFCLFVCLFSIIAVEIMNYFHLCVNSGDCYPCFFLVALFLFQVVSSHMGVHQHPAEKSRETLSESPDTSFSPLSSLSLVLSPFPSTSFPSLQVFSFCATFSYPVFFPANSIHRVFSISYLCLIAQEGPQTFCPVV